MTETLTVMILNQPNGKLSNTSVILNGPRRGSVVVREGYGGNGKDPNCDPQKLKRMVASLSGVN